MMTKQTRKVTFHAQVEERSFSSGAKDEIGEADKDLLLWYSNVDILSFRRRDHRMVNTLLERQVDFNVLEFMFFPTGDSVRGLEMSLPDTLQKSRRRRMNALRAVQRAQMSTTAGGDGDRIIKIAEAYMEAGKDVTDDALKRARWDAQFVKDHIRPTMNASGKVMTNVHLERENTTINQQEGGRIGLKDSILYKQHDPKVITQPPLTKQRSTRPTLLHRSQGKRQLI